MRKQKLLLTVAVALVSTPLTTTFTSHQVLAVQQQVQGERLVSLGKSLDAQQVEQTKQLLGANDVVADKVIYVDGNTVNRFLQDGSNASTRVYSSALIEQKPEGFGVQVQIVTPQNITLVKPITYQNAAITSGAKNVLIKIATVTPVTGEGALAGVYALLEKTGVQIDQKAVKVAEKEIKIVEQVKQSSGTDDAKINQVIADIKKEVTVNVTNETNINVTQIVETVVNNHTEINLTQQDVSELQEFAEQFAQTEAAQDQDTITQLEKSIDLNLDRPWLDVLNSINEKATVEELLKMERKDYSDASVYHPIIPALFNRFYEIAGNNGDITELYSHTFVVERALPNLSSEAKQALNQLRVYLYQYAENKEEDRKAEYESVGNPYVSLREVWVSNIESMYTLEQTNPVSAELVLKIAQATGYAPEAFMYNYVESTDNTFQIEVRESRVSQATLRGIYKYDPSTQVISIMDAVSGDFKELSTLFDFQKEYGVTVNNERVPLTEIPSNSEPIENSNAEESQLSSDVTETEFLEEVSTPESTSGE